MAGSPSEGTARHDECGRQKDAGRLGIRRDPEHVFERGIRTAASHEATTVSISANEETDDAGVIVGERSFFSSVRPSPPSTFSKKGGRAQAEDEAPDILFFFGII